MDQHRDRPRNRGQGQPRRSIALCFLVPETQRFEHETTNPSEMGDTVKISNTPSPCRIFALRSASAVVRITRASSLRSQVVAIARREKTASASSDARRPGYAWSLRLPTTSICSCGSVAGM